MPAAATNITPWVADSAPAASRRAEPMTGMAGVTGWVSGHKGIAAVAAAAVVALGLKLRTKLGAGSTSTTGTGTDTTGATTQTYGGAGYYDSTSTDLYNALTPQLQALQAQIGALKPGPVSTTTTPAAAAAATRDPWYTPGVHAIGKVGTMYNLRDLASKAVPAGSNPNTVESELRKIVAANPSLRNQTSVPGGTRLVIPA